MTKGILPITILVLVAGAASVTLGVVVGLNRAASVVKTTADEAERAVVTSNTTVTDNILPALRFSSSASAMLVGKNVDVDLLLDTKGKQLRGAGVVVTYDPKKLKVTEALPGSLFPSPVILEKKIDPGNGIVTLTFGSFTPVAGQGIFSTLKITPLVSGSTTLSFKSGPDSMAVVANSNGKALGLDQSSTLVLTIAGR